MYIFPIPAYPLKQKKFIWKKSKGGNGANPLRVWWWGSLATHPHPCEGGLQATPPRGVSQGGGRSQRPTLFNAGVGHEGPPPPFAITFAR